MAAESPNLMLTYPTGYILSHTMYPSFQIQGEEVPLDGFCGNLKINYRNDQSKKLKKWGKKTGATERLNAWLAQNQISRRRVLERLRGLHSASQLSTLFANSVNEVLSLFLHYILSPLVGMWYIKVSPGRYLHNPSNKVDFVTDGSGPCSVEGRSLHTVSMSEVQNRGSTLTLPVGTCFLVFPVSVQLPPWLE